MKIDGNFNQPFHFLKIVWSWCWEASNIQDNEFGLVAFLTVLLAAATLLTISLCYYTSPWKIKKPKLPLPPGPRGLPLLGSLPFLDPNLHSHFAALAQTYGPILKLKLGTKVAIVVSSPSLAKQVLKDHDITFANRDLPAMAKTMEYVSCNIVSSPYGPQWRMLRKLCVERMLSSSSLDAVYPLRRREVQRMVEDIYRNVGAPVNIGDQLFLTVLNVITCMLWGGGDVRQLGNCLRAEFRQVIVEITELLGRPDLSDFVPCLAWFDLQGMQRQTKRLFLRFDSIFDSIIEQRMKMGVQGGGKGSNEDFLQILLQLKEEEEESASKTKFTMLHVKALLMDMVVGGTETTSNTVEWAMAELMNNPEKMRRAQEELDIIVDKDSKVEESHLPKLHYLLAVMKEVLRLHPALPLLVPHCGTSSCNIGGYMVPKGARVFVNVWAIQRDPLIWDNPLEFHPERFLNNYKWDYRGNDFNYFPFGSGRRICAGIAMAERMFLYELATLLHLFNWELPEGPDRKKLDVREKFGIVLKKKTPLMAVPTPRLSNLGLYASVTSN